MNLSPLPIQKFFDSNGAPLVSGLLFTYIAGTTTKIGTGKDQAGTPNTNPIVLDYRGEANVWLNPTLTYKFTLAPPGDTDPPTKPIWTVDNITTGMTYADIIALITRTFIGLIFYPITAAEIAAGVTPTFYYYEPGDVRRYGAVLDGVTDDTAALTRWLSVGGHLEFPVAQPALISSAIPMVSNSTILMVEGATILTSTTNISLFTAAAKTNIAIRGGKFRQTAVGILGNIGHVVFDGCTYCSVEGVEFEGMQWAGVWLNNSDYCNIAANYFHSGLGNNQDAADINVYRVCRFNTITNNKCLGGGWHGISVQGPGAGAVPTRNIVADNYVGAHTAYGILCYNIDGGNTCDIIDGNIIEGITGVNPGGAGGAGIYVQNSGGVVVSNNDIRNCCLATFSVGLTPAGIGVVNINSPFAVTLTAAPLAGATSGTLTSAWTRVSGTYNVLFVETAGGAIEIRVATLTNGSTAITWVSGLTNNCNAAATTEGLIPVTISGNTVSDIAPNNTVAVTISGINVSSSTAGALITGNNVFQGAGTVAGIAMTTGIFISAANNVTISGNRVFMDPSITSSSAIFLFANGANITGFTVNGNVMLGCATAGMFVTSNVAFTTSNLSINGNVHSGGGPACISYRLDLLDGCAMSGNTGNTTTAQTLNLTSSLRTRVTGNSFISTGANVVITAGTCTGSYFDKSNYVAGSGGANIDAIQNAATGLIVEQFGNAAPGANNRAVGDRVEQSVPVVGNPKGWRTTVAGAPGTSVSEGNL